MTHPNKARERLWMRERLDRLRNALVYEHSEVNRRIMREEIEELTRSLKEPRQ